MTSKQGSRLEAFIVFAAVAAAAALLSGWLTFSVQFERRKEPKAQKPKSMSMAAWQMRELERKQQHDHYHLGRQDTSLDAWAEKSSCIICHTVYPHGRNKQATAIINLHTEFLTCTCCHLKPEATRRIRFDWVNPPGVTPSGFPYGTKIDPQTGLLAQTGNHVTKIDPFFYKDGAWKPVDTTADIAQALTFMADKNTYAEEKKKAIADQMHRDTEIRQFILCSQCHSLNGIMPFQKLGFDQARANQLQRMEISGMLTNYDTFYFPDLFKK